MWRCPCLWCSFSCFSSCSSASRSSGVEPVRISGPVGQTQEDQDPQDHRRNAPGDVHPLPALHPQKCWVVNRTLSTVSVVPIRSK